MNSSQQYTLRVIITLHLILFCVHFTCTSALYTQITAISFTACSFSLFIGSDVGWPANCQPCRPIAHPAHQEGPPLSAVYVFVADLGSFWFEMDSKVDWAWLVESKQLVLKCKDLLFRASLNRQQSLCCSPAFRHKVRRHFLTSEYIDRPSMTASLCFVISKVVTCGLFIDCALEVFM